MKRINPNPKSIMIHRQNMAYYHKEYGQALTKIYRDIPFFHFPTASLF